MASTSFIRNDNTCSRSVRYQFVAIYKRVAGMITSPSMALYCTALKYRHRESPGGIWREESGITSPSSTNTYLKPSSPSRFTSKGNCCFLLLISCRSAVYLLSPETTTCERWTTTTKTTTADDRPERHTICASHCEAIY